MMDLTDNAICVSQYGFKKSRSTGSVDTSVVYESGRHFVGPDKYFKTFQATAHIVSLRDIEIFTRYIGVSVVREKYEPGV